MGPPWVLADRDDFEEIAWLGCRGEMTSHVLSVMLDDAWIREDGVRYEHISESLVVKGFAMLRRPFACSRSPLISLLRFWSMIFFLELSLLLSLY